MKTKTLLTIILTGIMLTSCGQSSEKSDVSTANEEKTTSITTIEPPADNYTSENKTVSDATTTTSKAETTTTTSEMTTTARQQFQQGDDLNGTTWYSFDVDKEHSGNYFEITFDDNTYSECQYKFNREKGELEDTSVNDQYEITDNTISLKRNNETVNYNYRIINGILELSLGSFESDMDIVSERTLYCYQKYDNNNTELDVIEKLNGDWISEGNSSKWSFNSDDMTVTFSKESADWKIDKSDLYVGINEHSFILGETYPTGDYRYDLAFIDFIDDNTVKIGTSNYEFEIFIRQ